MNPALTWRWMFNVNGQFETLLGSWLIGVVQDALGCFGMLWNALECFGMLDWDDCCWWFWLDDCRGRKQRRKWRERANGNAATTCCATTSSPRSLSSFSPSPSNCFCWGPTPPRPSPSTGSSLLGFIYSFFEKNISWWNQGWDVIVPRGRGEGYQLQSSIALLPEHRYRFQNSIGFRGELFGFPLWESWKNLERILKESLKNLRRIPEISADSMMGSSGGERSSGGIAGWGVPNAIYRRRRALTALFWNSEWIVAGDGYMCNYQDKIAVVNWRRKNCRE